MHQTGLIEIFFGQPWPKQARLNYASFLRENGFGFYLYGPKADPLLRKQWTSQWPASYLRELSELASEYRNKGLKFGVVLSPFGLHQKIKKNSETLLKKKIQLLSEIGVDMLGIFFDDMPNAPGLVCRQVDVLKMVRSFTSVPLVFCPTFYSFDPILDRVFGKRSPDYLHEIGESVPIDVEILWTGPKVISDEIPDDHLVEVAKLLRRKPFICDNLFANDGPKNCKFIKLKNPTIITKNSLNHVSHWAFNPMNQPELSKVVLLAASHALQIEKPGQNHLEVGVKSCSKDFAAWLRGHRDDLLVKGLDGIADTDKKQMIENLNGFQDPAAAELIAWLKGEYTVGNECLTD